METHDITIHLEPDADNADNQLKSYSFSDRASIGRGTDMDFVLLDSESIVSKHHCDIYHEPDGIKIVDYSSNGTLLNDSPLSHSVPSLIDDGDKLIIGDFTIAVEIKAKEIVPPVREEKQPDPMDAHTDETNSDDHMMANTGSLTKSGASSTDIGPKEQDATQPPTTKANMMPERKGNETKPIQKTVADESPYEAFVRAAGISEKALDGMDPAKTMELAGQIIRTTVYGIRQTMLYRTKVKKYLESNITTLLPQDNNPLKFTVSEDHAINTIFSDQIKGFLPPDEAFRDIFNDIIQVMASTVEDSSSKNNHLVEVLNPANYEQRIKEHPHGSIPYYKYKVMWRMFSEDFDKLNRDRKSWQV